MPYLTCPGCRVSLSSASRSLIAASCPLCGTSQEAASKQYPAEAGTRPLRRELPSTPGAVARTRHALDGLRVELDGGAAPAGRRHARAAT